MAKLFTKIKANNLLIIFLITVLQVNQSLLALEAKTKITNIELKEDKKSSRVIIRLTKLPEKMPPLMATLGTISFELNACLASTLKPEILFSQNSFVKEVRLNQSLKNILIEIKRQYYTPISIKKEIKPPALIIELSRNYFNKESWELKPGIVRYLIRTENERGPIAANILEVDLSNEKIDIKVGLQDKKTIKAKSTLSNLVKSQMAFAGINANYFDVKAGNPLGTLITDGEWLIGSLYDRVAIGFTSDKKVLIDQVKLTGNVTIYRGLRKKPSAMFDIDGLNIPFTMYKKTGVFTTHWNEEITLPKNKIAFVIKDDRIKKIEKGSVKIPQDGYCLVSSESHSLNFLKKKDYIQIKWLSEPDWSNIKEAISGGPYLIKDGEVFIDEAKQNFKFGKKDTYAPRTAIGIGKNEKLYLVTIDGRKAGYSVGVTLREFAELLKKLDLQQAINLDGGGSTELFADGMIINKLSEHHERKISSALLVFYKE